MVEELDRTVSQIVADDYRAAAIFQRHGIDFCCGGGRPLDEACRARGVDPAAVRTELAGLAEEANRTGFDDNALELDALAGHIIETHHRYVREAAPRILEHVRKVARVHGDRHPETIAVARSFEQLIDELTAHMGKEETILFPQIVRMARAAREGGGLPAVFFGSVANPIAMMEREHRAAGDEMAEIRELTGGYAPPADACMTYRVAYNELREFELDLHRHVHLENNILFPKAVALERKLAA